MSSVAELVRLANMVDDFRELREVANRVAEQEPAAPIVQHWGDDLLISIRATYGLAHAAYVRRQFTSAVRYAALLRELAQELESHCRRKEGELSDAEQISD